MSSSLIKMGLSTVALASAFGYYMSLDQDDKVALAAFIPGWSSNENTPVQSNAPQSATDAKPVQSASVVSIPRVNGQYYAQAQVNRGSVRFLVDTGASTIALTLEDARKAGINLNALRYTTPVHTANGVAYAAPVRLDEVRIGGIRLRNVQGLVIKEGLNISLLGMTFLGELQKVEATPTQLILRL